MQRPAVGVISAEVCRDIARCGISPHGLALLYIIISINIFIYIYIDSRARVHVNPRPGPCAEIITRTKSKNSEVGPQRKQVRDK